MDSLVCTPGERLCQGQGVARVVHLDDLRPRITEDGQLVGKIVVIDNFGNLITNIDSEVLSEMYPAGGKRKIQILFDSHVISGLSATYDNVRLKTPLALIGSRGYLEIAVNKGHAARTLKAHKGDTVWVRV